MLSTIRTSILLLTSLAISSGADHIAFRGPALHFLDADTPVYLKDALLVVDETSGKIVDFDDFAAASGKFNLSSIRSYPPGHLITPGFIDCHSHAPQIDMIASYGDSLEDWLHDYTFPNEAEYMNEAFAKSSARRYFNQLVRSGTTSALIYNAIFPVAVTAVFNEALRRNMRIITGLNGMSDCAYAPEFHDADGKIYPMCNSLRFDDVRGEISAETIENESRSLYNQYHGNGRLLYALMPRFLTTSTPAELETWARLHHDYPEAFFHTHIAENLQVSISSVANFKEKAATFYEGYSERLEKIQSSVTQMEIWDAYGLLSNHTSFAHGIHLTHRDYDLLRNSSSTLCHCPTSNLFLNSGLFNLAEALRNKIDVGIGTDVGAGTTFELLSTMGEVYKVSMASADAISNMVNPEEPYLNATISKSDEYKIPVKSSYRLSPFTQLYMMTLGTARQLRIDEFVGNFAVGKEADFVVLDLQPSPLHSRRLTAYASNAPSDLERLSDALFGIISTSHDRSVIETYIMGKKAYDREVNYLDSLDSDYQDNLYSVEEREATSEFFIRDPLITSI